jgi:hypothetical protein
VTREHEIVLWLIFASISIGGIGLVTLLVWVTVRAMVRGVTRDSTVAPSAIALPALGSASLRSSVGIVATIWLSLLVLVPLLALALWQFAVELESGRVGASLVVALVHLSLIWILLRLGTRVQRQIDISRTELVVHPVIGLRRELAWNGIVRVEEVRYIGPGVSGLYLYDGAEAAPAVLDVWLPNWESLRLTVRELAPHASWSHRKRGWLIA